MVKKSKKTAHLLVEGHNDLHVISHLCQAHKIPETFDILTPRKSGQAASGDIQVLQNLRIQLLAKGKKAIGVVLDADNNLTSRWQQVSGRQKLTSHFQIKAVEGAASSLQGNYTGASSSRYCLSRFFALMLYYSLGNTKKAP